MALTPGDPCVQTCPSCGTLVDISEQEPLSKFECPTCGATMRASRQYNHFSIVEHLGTGGMGSVYKAMDRNLNRMVALKLLRRELSADETYIAKLEDEARITASINHPFVVKVFSFGVDHGQYYIAMELVDKGTLDDLMQLQNRISEMQVLQVGLQVASGLQAAHERGLIHRDVKPGNILFADAHTAKITDFGLGIAGRARGRRARRNLGHALLHRAGKALQPAGGFPQRHLQPGRHAFPRRRGPSSVRGGYGVAGGAQAPQEQGRVPASVRAGRVQRDELRHQPDAQQGPRASVTLPTGT